VAAVDPDGRVRALSMGVATVTCSVTIDGRTLEDSFAVKVMPDLSLAGLTVGGKAVDPGNSAQISYLLKGGKAPEVKARASSPAIDVDVRQAPSVPGTAVVTLLDNETGDSRALTVNFGTRGVSDSFKKSALAPAWSWVREDPAAWTLAGAEGLVLTAGKGDITQGSNSASNILLQSANSDWTADTRMHCFSAPAAPAQNAGLVAYESDDNFVKFVYSATFNFRRPAAGPSAGQLQLLVEENGRQRSLASLGLDGIVGEDQVLFLRLDKQGDSYTAFYSLDGRKYEQMGTATAVLKDVRVGVIACEGEAAAMMRGVARGGAQQPAAAPLKVSFSDFKLVNRGRK
jgi:hypothetical protein